MAATAATSGSVPAPSAPTSLGRVRAEAVVLAAVPFVVLAAVAGLWPLWRRVPSLAGVTTLVVTALVTTGLALLADRTQRHVGTGLVLAGVLLEVSWCNEWGGGPLPLISLLEGHGWLFLVGWALFRYPGPALTGVERRVFHAVTAWVLTWPWALVLTSHPNWREYPASAWWPSPFADRTVHAVATWCIDLTAVGALGAYLALWVRRVRAVRGARRADLLRSAVAAAVGAGCAALAPLADALRLPLWLVDRMDTVATVGVLAIPGALLVTVARRHLARAGLAALLVELRTARTPQAAVDALRRALGDDTLAVALWSPEHGAHLDGGRAVRPGDAAPGARVVAVTSTTGEPLALVAGDVDQHPDGDLFGAACAAFGLSLENARSLVTAHRRLVDLRAATERARTAAHSERRRLEQDLHDGAQARFLALAPLIGAAQARAADPATSAALDEIRAELRGAVAELRRLLHDGPEDDGPGLPAGGLAEAVADLAALSTVPLTVDLRLPGERLPAPVERTAYLVICEAVANALKHARAASVTVEGRVDGDRLAVLVRDDGRGGAVPGAGRGLAGMAERARTAGGRLAVTSPPGGGTTLELELPCG